MFSRMKSVMTLLAVSTQDTKPEEGCFTAGEHAIIGSPEDGTMRVLTVDVPADLTFLRRKALPLSEKELNGADFLTLCARMLATVNDPKHEGVGIAAPQTGISRRVIAVQRFDKAGENLNEAPFGIYVNPVITYYSDEKVSAQEGCLSVPGDSGQVERAVRITVEYTDPQTSERHAETIEGFTAIVFQHETDHLDGVIFTDKVHPPEIKTFSFTPMARICPSEINITIEDGLIGDITFTGGCSGNAQAVAALLRGTDPGEAIELLEGIKCGDKGTSCPDQLAYVLKMILYGVAEKN